MSRSSPNREQAIYCINAVIVAALKYPMQVAKVPMTQRKQWDAKHRERVRAAGKLPRMAPWFFHSKKKEGGLGLMSLADEIGKIQAGAQIDLLNQQTKAGRVVRAAWSRNARAPDPHWTVQATVTAWATQQGMRITRQRKKDWFNQEQIEFVGIDEQHAEDVAAAHRNRKESHGTQ